jgi:uncharacterized protein
MIKNRFLKVVESILLIITVVLISFACNEKKQIKNSNPGYVKEILNERTEKDSSMQFDDYSPFKRDTSVSFTGLKYFLPDESFLFKSKLYRLNPPDTVTVMGTKGEARRVIVEGYVSCVKDKKDHHVNVYKGFSQTGEPYYSIWFTDQTTGKETYGVGRYLDFEYNEDPDFVYTIDFNKAYNPYCAYTKLYTCPVPRKEDYIDMSIEAGEKNYH